MTIEPIKQVDYFGRVVIVWSIGFTKKLFALICLSYIYIYIFGLLYVPYLTNRV